MGAATHDNEPDEEPGRLSPELARLASVNLNLLVPLLALVEERSVTRAAARVGLTQPAMSHALVRIRRLLGDEVLVRQGTRMVLTPRAVELADPLRQAIQQATRVVVVIHQGVGQTQEHQVFAILGQFLLHPLEHLDRVVGLLSHHIDHAHALEAFEIVGVEIGRAFVIVEGEIQKPLLEKDVRQPVVGRRQLGFGRFLAGTAAGWEEFIRKTNGSASG